MKRIKNFLFYSFPAVLFFSYYPLLSLGSNASMNFEFSLPLIWLFCFALLSLKDFYDFLISLKSKKSPWILKLALLFPLYLSLSIVWSPNPLRAVLTSGIVWCIFISLAGFCSILKSKNLNLSLLKKVFLVSASLVCLFCWLQCFLDVFGVSRETTLLCLGCTSRIFGFPHPSGFAIEPQFMGNLLLAPTLYSIYLYTKTEQKVKKPNEKSIPFLLLLFSSTLFLTFSRGAIYAFAVGLAVFLVVSLVKKLFPLSVALKTLALTLVAFLFALTAQGIFSELSSTNDTFSSGVAKSLNQLSLGIIDFRTTKIQSPEDTTEESVAESSVASSDDENPENPENFSVFDGYVEESTNFRLDLNAYALSASLDSPANFLFGYGLGSAGTVMFEKGFTSSPKEIVQNEYFSLLLETGLLGLLLFFAVLILFFYETKKSLGVSLEGIFLASLSVAFLITLSFFSGLPNALHLYLLPPLFLFSFQTRIGHKSKS